MKKRKSIAEKVRHYMEGSSLMWNCNRDEGKFAYDKENLTRFVRRVVREETAELREKFDTLERYSRGR